MVLVLKKYQQVGHVYTVMKSYMSYTYILRHLHVQPFTKQGTGPSPPELHFIAYIFLY